ncbi:membrane glycoprotein US2 [Cercopithecine betaherpesvirus 5]|uniref:Membrane glycoprotein US2 n=1 Tax=Simian cytomegalovirus (strain Colburn) TaxID=50292 RepID=G8XTL0_SCMVC|nr:membrane glycoprotein US2 [Cercopithecine betaherpesvirus 5]AEV80502.1 membrane glycoprotein US2 [Cercopithecine betaherpesvirus 5]
MKCLIGICMLASVVLRCGGHIPLRMPTLYGKHETFVPPPSPPPLPPKRPVREPFVPPTVPAGETKFTVHQEACYIENRRLFMTGRIEGNITYYHAEGNQVFGNQKIHKFIFINRDLTFVPGKEVRWDFRYYEVHPEIQKVIFRIELDTFYVMKIDCEPEIKPDFVSPDIFWAFARMYVFGDWWYVSWIIFVAVVHYIILILFVTEVGDENLRIALKTFLM